MNRYDRQIRVAKIGRSGQEKLHNASVMIIGCGALGSYSAEQLLRAGIKSLILIDHDVVEETNLQRQALYTASDAKAARPKVFAAKEHLLEIDPSANIQAINAYFDQALFENFDPVDLVLDCTDNFQVRHLINEYCYHYQLPFVFAACAGTSGQVMAFHPIKGPCLACVFPEKEQRSEDCETIGVITPLIPFVTSVQISLAFQILTDKDFSDWQTMHVLELWPLATSSFKINKQTTCHCCSSGEQTSATFKINKLCGDSVFQINNLKDIKWDKLIQYCLQQGWQVQQNPLAIRIASNQQEITGFRSGRFTFYGFESAESVQHFVTQLPLAERNTL